MISTIYVRAWDKSNFPFYSGGKQVKKICKCKKSWSSLSILDNRKLRTFHLKMIMVNYGWKSSLEAEVTVNVLIANNDVNLLEK